ncbi:hypothetical protein [Haloarcula pelagica]|uniref:hypothetical protein n=1 Tax=Haloarcula pelagica TaxID=3033389 RepID=UPI0024C2E8F0|nr:hypothetical protein [Halomicroarcula sp. YJ-61-S]
MYASNSSGKKASADFDQTVQLGARVDGPEHLLQQVAETKNGDELDFRPNKGLDSRGNFYERQNDYDWTRDTEVGPNRRHGETLAMQEQRLGEEAEQARHSETARAAHADGVERARSSRQLTDADTDLDHEDIAKRQADPREGMEAETLAQVNERARRVARQTTMTAAAAGRCIAETVANGGSPLDGELDALMAARDRMNSPVPFAEVDADGGEVTVEGEVTHIIKDPNSRSQYQVLYLEDDAGTSAKVTIWDKAVAGPMVRTLHEGDRVRIYAGKPGEYRGTTTVAVTSKSTMCILEDGDGPAPTGDRRSSWGCSGDSPRTAPWDPKSDTHQWAHDTERVTVVTGDGDGPVTTITLKQQT